MAESQATVARPQVRLLLLLIACLLGLATVVTRSREPKPPAPTGLSVPAQVRMSAPMRLGGAALELRRSLADRRLRAPTHGYEGRARRVVRARVFAYNYTCRRAYADICRC